MNKTAAYNLGVEQAVRDMLLTKEAGGGARMVGALEGKLMELLHKLKQVPHKSKSLGLRTMEHPATLPTAAGVGGLGVGAGLNALLSD